MRAWFGSTRERGAANQASRREGSPFSGGRGSPHWRGRRCLLLVAVQASLGQAQGSADFYQGKTLRIVISTGVAGGFGEYARLLSEHIGKHIAGRPHVIVQSMPGAGGLLAANSPLCVGAAGRHHHRHHQLDGAVRAALGQQGRAFRHPEVQLARHPRSCRRRVHALAHFAGEDLAPTCWSRSSRSGASARVRRWSSTRRC